jgi:hypothetical protein
VIGNDTVKLLTPTTNDMPTKYGSKIYENYNTPGLDASVVALCRQQGAIILGKTVRSPTDVEFDSLISPGDCRVRIGRPCNLHQQSS